MSKQILIDESRGIYIPKLLGKQLKEAINSGLIACKGIDDLDIYLSELENPENERYWDAYDYIINNITIYFYAEQKSSKLYHDQDLFIYDI